MAGQQPLTWISAALDGTVYGIDNGTVLQALSQPWTKVIGGPLSSIGAASDGTVWAVYIPGNNQPNSVFIYAGGNWQQVNCSYQLTQISVGSSANVWALDG